MPDKEKGNQIPPLYVPIPLLLLLTLVALILMGIFLFTFTSRLKVSQGPRPQVQRLYQSPQPAVYPTYSPVPRYLP